MRLNTVSSFPVSVKNSCWRNAPAFFFSPVYLGWVGVFFVSLLASSLKIAVWLWRSWPSNIAVYSTLSLLCSGFIALHTLPEKSALTNSSLWRSLPCPSERKQRSQHKLKIEKAMKCFTINTNDRKLDVFLVWLFSLVW